LEARRPTWEVDAEIERLYRRNKRLAEEVKKVIWKYADRVRRVKGDGFKVKIMNFCGTHEWTTVHYGIRSLLPDNVELVAGPGCPVCVTPSFIVEHAIRLSLEGVRVYTFGDSFKLPAVRPVKGVRNLAEAKTAGGDVQVVYSFLDALKDIANTRRESVFLAIGFETTAPGYALPLAERLIPRELSILSALRLTPPAARYAIAEADRRGLTPIKGIVAPGHVSAITGAKPWDELSRELKIPTVVSGFEPIDLLISIAEILRMILRGEVGVKVEYRRVVSWEGNREALKAIYRVFEKTDAAWRGIGFIEESGLELRSGYREFDGFDRYGLEKPDRENWVMDNLKGCRCAEVVLGLVKPTDCKFFLKGCSPSKPLGPCMVSSEGTCSIWARFGGYLDLKNL